MVSNDELEMTSMPRVLYYPGLVPAWVLPYADDDVGVRSLWIDIDDLIGYI